MLRDKGYTTLQDEAIKIFNSLQQLESVPDPVPIIQGVLQTGHDLRPLRDELYCQLIKQTAKVPQPGSTGDLRRWELLTCLSCTFLPSRGILKYLRFHLRRWAGPAAPTRPRAGAGEGLGSATGRCTAAWTGSPAQGTQAALCQLHTVPGRSPRQLSGPLTTVLCAWSR